MPGVSWHLYLVQNSHPKDWCVGSHSHLALPCCELAVSRMKRGEGEDVMVGCVFQASLVWSVPLPMECQCWCPHTPDPLHQTFHPLSKRKALGNVLRNAWSLLFTHPRGVLPVWHWAGHGQLTLCGAFSVSLSSGVCSSRVVGVHLACLAHMIVQRGVPSVGVMRKSQFQ